MLQVASYKIQVAGLSPLAKGDTGGYEITRKTKGDTNEL